MQTRSIVALSWFNFVCDEIEKWDFGCCIGWKAFIGYLCPKYYFSRLCICRPTGFDIVNLDYYGIFSFCNKTRRATSNNMHICSLFGMGQLKTRSCWSNVYFIFISIILFSLTMQFPTVWLLFWKYLWSVFGVGYQKTGSITWVGRSHKGKCETFSTAKVKLGQKYFQTSYFCFWMFTSFHPSCLSDETRWKIWLN